MECQWWPPESYTAEPLENNKAQYLQVSAWSNGCTLLKVTFSKTSDDEKFGFLKEWMAEASGSCYQQRCVRGHSRSSFLLFSSPPVFIMKCSKKGVCLSDALNTRRFLISPFPPVIPLHLEKINALQSGLLAPCHWWSHTRFSMSGWTIARSRLRVSKS